MSISLQETDAPIALTYQKVALPLIPVVFYKDSPGQRKFLLHQEPANYYSILCSRPLHYVRQTLS